MYDTHLGLDQFRAAWADRMAAKGSAHLSPSEHWGLRRLAAGDTGPLSQAAALDALDTERH